VPTSDCKSAAVPFYLSNLMLRECHVYLNTTVRSITNDDSLSQ
jgi:hypothetical protein